MIARLVFLLLSGALLAQHLVEAAAVDRTTAKVESTSISAATTETISDVDIPTSDSEFDDYVDHLKALVLVLDDFYDLTYTTVRSGRILFENVIADEKIASNKQLESKTEILHEFNKIVDNFRPSFLSIYIDEYIEVLEKFKLVLSTLSAKTLKKPSDEDLVIDAALRKYGLQNMEKELAKSFSTYGKRLLHEIEEFEEALPSDETDYKDIKDWIMELRNLASKVNTFAKFMEEQL